jgi:hypothetical protein
VSDGGNVSSIQRVDSASLLRVSMPTTAAVNTSATQVLLYLYTTIYA